MKTTKLLRTAAFSLIAVAPGLVFAEAGMSTCEEPCTVGSVANDVNLQVNVPKMLIFKVGDLEDVVNTIGWTLSPTGYAPDQTDASYSGSVPFTSADFDAPEVTDDESDGGDDGVLSVYAFGNDGDINIASTASNGETLNNADGQTIPLTDFTVTGDSHPSDGTNGLHNGANGLVTATDNVAELDTTWTYAYAPTTTPAAGEYTTVITYTASMP